MKKRRSFFYPALLCYMLVLVLLVLIGLTVLWRFLQQYERSLPENTLQKYKITRLQQDYRDFLAQWSQDHATALQDAQSVREYVERFLDANSLELRRPVREGDTVRSQIVLMGGRIGYVVLEEFPLDSPAFGLNGYRVSSVQWELQDTFSTEYTLQAPEDAVVKINGSALTEANAQTEVVTLTGELVSQEYGSDSEVLYRFAYYGIPEPEPQDTDAFRYQLHRNGTEFTVSRSCRWEHCMELAGQAEQFVRDYVAYGANAGSYGYVLRHLIQGTSLYTRITGSVDGMHWVNGVSSRISNFSVEYFEPYRNGVICTVHYDLNYTGGLRSPTSMRILMVPTDNGWKIHNIEMI